MRTLPLILTCSTRPWNVLLRRRYPLFRTRLWDQCVTLHMSLMTLVFDRFRIQSDATHLNSSLLTVSVIGVLLPAAFHMAVTPDTSTETDPLTDAEEKADLLKLSHGVRPSLSR